MKNQANSPEIQALNSSESVNLGESLNSSENANLGKSVNSSESLNLNESKNLSDSLNSSKNVNLGKSESLNFSKNSNISENANSSKSANLGGNANLNKNLNSSNSLNTNSATKSSESLNSSENANLSKSKNLNSSESSNLSNSLNSNKNLNPSESINSSNGTNANSSNDKILNSNANLSASINLGENANLNNSPHNSPSNNPAFKVKLKRHLAGICGFLCALFLCVLFTQDGFAKDSAANSKDELNKRIQALDKYTKTLAIIEQYYVEDQNISDLVDKSISGMLTNLDAHSSFLDEKSLNDMKIQTTGEFGGLGITIGMKDGALTVIAPIEGTPADKAGIKSGDVILRIDGEATLGMDLNAAVDKMRGKPKSEITITIYRKGGQKPFDLTLKRDIIKVESVYSKKIGDDILYLRVTTFDKNVAERTSKALRANKNAKGIILDLRNNPGGLLDQAIELTNLFVDKGVIVSQKGKIEAENKIYEAVKGKKITDTTLVVLVNGGSASASEIVSGALQDHKRALVLGEKTFGKGSVQSIIPINKNEALRLTIARYYLPSGRTIQAVGLEPDIEVAPGKITSADESFSIKESDLKQHLQGELEKMNADKKDEKIEKKADKDIITSTQVNEDAQLKAAVDAIKILNIQKR